MVLGRIILYAKDVETTVGFYQKHFGFKVHRQESDRIIELIHDAGGASLMIHPAGKAQRQGQSAVKLVFDVEDVDGFRDRCLAQGLAFGPVHKADGYLFSNARDPGGNAVSISSRAFRPAGDRKS